MIRFPLNKPLGSTGVPYPSRGARYQVRLRITHEVWQPPAPLQPTTDSDSDDFTGAAPKDLVLVRQLSTSLTSLIPVSYWTVFKIFMIFLASRVVAFNQELWLTHTWLFKAHFLHGKMQGIMCISKWKKKKTKSLYESNYMTFWKRQNYGKKKMISGCQGLGGRGNE